MSRVLLSDANLSAIASAIRTKLGVQTAYRPSEMASAIASISPQPNLQQKTATANGTVTPDAGYDGLSQVTVNVVGGAVAAFLKITYTPGAACTASDGTTTLTAPDTSGYWVAALPNAGTWTVAVSRTGQSDSVSVAVAYADSIEKNVRFHVGAGYTEVEYLAVGGTAGPYIDTGITCSNDCYFEVKFQFLSGVSNNVGVLGAWAQGKATQIAYSTGRFYYQLGGTEIQKTADNNIHVYAAQQNAMVLDGVVISASPNWNNVPSQLVPLFATTVSGSTISAKANMLRIYYCKFYDGDDLVREFYPCYRNSDNEPGLYDAVNDVFYPNSGTGAFTVGPDV